jgi:bifunctional non-homologous end joining protein LigD
VGTRKDLAEYRDKRDFRATPEPSGSDKRKAGQGLRFVIQQHDASSLHWDLRLEREGVLLSWALPKGVPQHPDSNRLAVRTEDHPLDYIDFEGRIPEGEYGAGTMEIWDSGTYEESKFRDDEVIITLRGERVSGQYALFHTRGKDWMIHRMDPPADPGRQPMPEHVAPMLATAGDLPRDRQEFAYELKWDGVRAIAYAEGGHVRAESRNGLEISPRYPELRRLGRSLGALEVILDGELVAFGEDGLPSFERLQARMHLGSDSAVRRAARDNPVTFAIFDLLWLEGRSTTDLPYSERRRVLEELALSGPHWRTPEAHDDGDALLAATRERGLEGVTAKRRDSCYEPGRRSSAWIKVKNRRSQELVVGGWLPGEGSRAGGLGSLLVGYWDPPDGNGPPRLKPAGRVGSGLTQADIARLQKLLAPLARPDSPFDGGRLPREAQFVDPVLVARVEFAEWTRSGTLRAPVFKGLRDDVDPRSVVREDA